MVNPEWVPLLDGNPDLDEIVVFPRRKFQGLGGIRRFFRWQRQTVHERRPDLALDFQGLLRTAIIGRLSRPRALLGMSDAREGAAWFYNQTATIPDGPLHSVTRYLLLSEFALQRDGGNLPAPSTTASIRFPLPPGEPPDGLEREKLRNDYVLLHPFSRGTGKSLSGEQVEEFCRVLSPRQVVLVGNGRGRMDHVPPGALDLLERTSLHQLIWVIRHAAFVISVDSGPAHLAAALNRPLIAIHTWSDPRKVGPYRPDAWVWKSGRLVQMHELATMDPALFDQPPPELSSTQIGDICALATSPSNFCA